MHVDHTTISNCNWIRKNELKQTRKLTIYSTGEIQKIHVKSHSSREILPNFDLKWNVYMTLMCVLGGLCTLKNVEFFSELKPDGVISRENHVRREKNFLNFLNFTSTIVARWTS